MSLEAALDGGGGPRGPLRGHCRPRESAILQGQPRDQYEICQDQPQGGRAAHQRPPARTAPAGAAARTTPVAGRGPRLKEGTAKN